VETQAFKRPLHRELESSGVNTQVSSPSARRDTGWKRDRRARGVYWRRRANGSKSWGFYADGKIHSASSRVGAVDGKARAQLRKSAGLPPPDTRVLIGDLAEEVRESKRRKLASSSFVVFEYALDKIILPELGHLKPAACGPDRVARLIRDLEERGLAPASIRRYLTPLAAIFKLALRRGIVPSSPLALLSDEERATGGGVREHYIWSPEEVSKLISAAQHLGKRPEARYDYSPLIELLVLAGLRVSEALGLCAGDVDLVAGELHVRHSWQRNGELKDPKTDAGKRTVPLSPGLVDLFARLIPAEADPQDFVFRAQGNPHRPISYWNFRRRGFEPAIEAAGLAGRGITIHGLRSAAISLYAARGLTILETAVVMGQKDALVTWKHYARLFDRSDVDVRVRAAQASIEVR
jgi:integrase